MTIFEFQDKEKPLTHHLTTFFQTYVQKCIASGCLVVPLRLRRHI